MAKIRNGVKVLMKDQKLATVVKNAGGGDWIVERKVDGKRFAVSETTLTLVEVTKGTRPVLKDGGEEE